MSARRQIIAALSEDSMGGIATLHDVAHAEQLVDAHRTEVIAKAIGRLRAIPITCTALTGPVWYGDGWNSAITVLEEIADYQTPDDEAYPGELQRLRALVLGLRVAALRKEDMAQVQWLLTDHDETRKKSTAPAPPATPAPDGYLPEWLTSIGLAGSETERALYQAYEQAMTEVRQLREEKATPEGATATPELTVYRASHDSIVMGLYTSREAAQTHCEAKVQQEEPAGSIRHMSWVADDIGPDAEYELHITPAGTGELIRGTGYVVTPLTVASAYDEEADE